jgi:uncharacterized membrane protein YqiK
VVDSERKVTIADYDAQAAVKMAEGQAESKKINAAADAEVTQLTGQAEAGKIKAVGTAEGDVIRLKIASMESGNYAAIEVARALASSGFKLVPDIIAGGGDGGGSSLVNVLLAGMIKDQMNGTRAAASQPAPVQPAPAVVPVLGSHSGNAGEAPVSHKVV